ncbi:MAG: DUF4387 domain-containing protein [Hyphomonadaceae bacterium]|nr:DUF4387 domain-containing protein [Hyphomonadaceae bacterium]
MTPTFSTCGARLRDVAACIRGKNAGPFVVTMDIFFPDAATYERIVRADILRPAAIAPLYGVDAEVVQVICVPQAHAIKVTLPRPRPAGDVGERDVAGGQQFGRLLDIVVPAEDEGDI